MALGYEVQGVLWGLSMVLQIGKGISTADSAKTLINEHHGNEVVETLFRPGPDPHAVVLLDIFVDFGNHFQTPGQPSTPPATTNLLSTKNVTAQRACGVDRPRLDPGLEAQAVERVTAVEASDGERHRVGVGLVFLTDGAEHGVGGFDRNFARAILRKTTFSFFCLCVFWQSTPKPPSFVTRPS